MAYVDDNERDKRPGLGIMPAQSGAPAPTVGAPMAGGGGAAPSAPTAAPHARGTGFVGLEQYLMANRGQGANMAGQVAQNVGAEGQKAKGELDAYNSMAFGGRGSAAPSYAEVNPAAYMQAQTDASKAASDANLASGQGVGALLQQQYGTGGGYGSGMRGFDSFLSRAEGGTQLDALGGQYGNLGGYLGLQGQNYHPTPAPGTAPGTDPGKQGPGNARGKLGPGINMAPPVDPTTTSSSAGYMGMGSGYGSPGYSPGSTNAGMSRGPGPSRAPPPPPIPGHGLTRRKKDEPFGGGGR